MAGKHIWCKMIKVNVRKVLGINKEDWRAIVKAAKEVGLSPDEWITSVVVNRASYCLENKGLQSGHASTFTCKRW